MQLHKCLLRGIVKTVLKLHKYGEDDELHQAFNCKAEYPKEKIAEDEGLAFGLEEDEFLSLFDAVLRVRAEEQGYLSERG